MKETKQTSKNTGIMALFRRVLRAINRRPYSREEIQDLFQENNGVIDPDEREMLTGVFDVAEMKVRDVMIPRSQMIVVNEDDSLEEILSTIVKSGHSRFPIMNKESDESIGVLLAKDLLRHYMNGDNDTLSLHKYIRPLSIIPESKRLNTLLKEFRVSRNHMAVVVDEYGGISGLLTIEDVIEEIVGEIDDEHDPHEQDQIEILKNIKGLKSYNVPALTRLEDFNEYFKCNLDDSSYDTIGGLVVNEFGRLPRNGEKLIFSGFKFKVTKTHRRRIEALEVEKDRN
tara:strand:+ start:178 stop:1032 length:855 start_codon:yes stop_codon:yes gene_type:complete